MRVEWEIYIYRFAQTQSTSLIHNLPLLCQINFDIQPFINFRHNDTVYQLKSSRAAMLSEA